MPTDDPTTTTDPEIMVLGRELDRHGQTHGLVGLPTSEFTNHLTVIGTTGSGKSTTGTVASTTGHECTAGATIIIDPKGDGWPTELARTHYARHGTLDDVLYFDCTEFLPAISFFDVRMAESRDSSRLRAVQTVVDQLLAVIDAVRVDDQTAIRAPDVIRYLATALFDPVHGDDVYGITDLITALRRLRETHAMPQVSTTWAETLLESVTMGPDRMVETILQGGATRLEKIYGDGYLRPMFDTTPAAPDDAFRFDQWLDEDVLIIFDLGGLTDRGQRVIAATLLALCWRALPNRSAQYAASQAPPTSLLFLDEVPHLEVESQLVDLLAMGRGHGLGVVPMLQHPRQLGHEDDRSQDELLENVHSILAGRIPDADRLAERLSDSTRSAAELSNRLGSLRDDWWLFAPATPRDVPPVSAHTIADPPLPPGHPDGATPLSAATRTQFTAALEACRTRTQESHGVAYDAYTATATQAESAPLAESFTEFEPAGTGPPPSTDGEQAASATTDDGLAPATQAALQADGYRTTFPLLEDHDLPDPVAYDADRQAVVCDACGGTRPATLDGLFEAIRCHGSLTEVAWQAIPPVAVNLTLSADEIAAAPVSGKQLCGLQIIHNIAQHEYDPVEVSLVHDSIDDVLAPLGITAADIAALEDAGLLTQDSLREYTYYTVTAAGRDLLNEDHRHDVDWGHGEGDLTETLIHIVLIEALVQYIHQEYGPDGERTPTVTRVIPYYEPEKGSGTIPESAQALDGKTRLDVVGLTAADDIAIIAEAELNNNDNGTGVVDDYDTIAAFDPAVALWAVPSSSRGQASTLQPLADPPDDDGLADTTQRITGYSEATRIKDISGLDSPGMTDIHILNTLRKALPEPTVETAAARSASHPARGDWRDTTESDPE
jgi:hypothetical protein